MPRWHPSTLSMIKEDPLPHHLHRWTSSHTPSSIWKQNDAVNIHSFAVCLSVCLPLLFSCKHSTLFRSSRLKAQQSDQDLFFVAAVNGHWTSTTWRRMDSIVDPEQRVSGTRMPASTQHIRQCIAKGRVTPVTDQQHVPSCVALPTTRLLSFVSCTCSFESQSYATTQEQDQQHKFTHCC